MSKNSHEMTLEEKIGQLFVFGFDALEMNNNIRSLINDYKLGNVILFTRNIKTPKQLFNLNQELQKQAIESLQIPLLITIDQEGGMVTRIMNGGTFFPGALTITASNNESNSYLSGKLMGEELIRLGVNMNLAPVLDVNNNHENPVIGVRSFSDKPEVVSRYGTKFIAGLQENVIATAKHFPGHGDTVIDSHLGLPRISYGRDRLDQIELYPFKEAIKNGVKAIMTSHINFDAFTENNLPATLSKQCLTGLLREELGFEGLIITDGMQMKAIADTYGTVEGSLMAIEAGANLVCICHSEELQKEAVEHVFNAVKNGRLSEATINERVSKVLECKKDIHLYLHDDYETVRPIVERKATKDFALDVVRQALTLVRGDKFEYSKSTLVIACDPYVTSVADDVFNDRSIINNLHKTLPEFDSYKLSLQPTKDEVDELKRMYHSYEKVVICSYNANLYKEQFEVIDSLSDHPDLHVVAMRNPYDHIFAKNVKNLVYLYEYTNNSVQVLMEYLQGKIEPSGVIPIG